MTDDRAQFGYRRSDGGRLVPHEADAAQVRETAQRLIDRLGEARVRQLAVEQFAAAFGQGGIFITAAALDAEALGSMASEGARLMREGLADTVLAVETPQDLHDMFGLNGTILEHLVLWYARERREQAAPAEGEA